SRGVRHPGPLHAPAARAGGGHAGQGGHRPHRRKFFAAGAAVLAGRRMAFGGGRRDGLRQVPGAVRAGGGKPVAVLADKTLLTIELQLFAQDEGEERQEPATQKRRQEARRRGEVFQSREMSAALLLLAAMGVFAAAGPWTARAINDIFQVSYGQWLAGDWGMGDLGSWSAAVTKALLVAVGPMMLGLVVLALGLGLVQTGFLWTTVPLAPKLERINPAAGAKRIFSRR